MDDLVNLVVTVRSEAECLNFLRLIYEGKEYTCDGLKKYVNENGLNFDTVLKEITIKYRGNSKKYLEYVDGFNEIGFKLLASELYLREGNVRNYLSSILDKLQLRDRNQVAIFYYRHK